MLRHIVLFRRRRDVPPDPEGDAALVARMQALGARIPVIRHWVFRANELDRPICWDHVLESEVDDAQALHDYLFHPEHQALVADLRPRFEWAAVDYTV
ncbi:MAG: hypothetical protein RL223_597 [Pseudomonadota bacterium]|jgi:hypothetical protein